MQCVVGECLTPLGNILGEKEAKETSACEERNY